MLGLPPGDLELLSLGLYLGPWFWFLGPGLWILGPLVLGSCFLAAEFLNLWSCGSGFVAPGSWILGPGSWFVVPGVLDPKLWGPGSHGLVFWFLGSWFLGSGVLDPKSWTLAADVLDPGS